MTSNQTSVVSNLSYLKIMDDDPGFLDSIHGSRLGFAGRWEERNWLNVPGPFYGAQTDTCGCGPFEAPHNILIDEAGREFIFRQPRNLDELRAVLRGAWIDPFDGYGSDGNAHWTSDLVREWWLKREEILSLSHEFRAQSERYQPIVDEWRQYLQSTELKQYLRQYLFYLKSRNFPSDGEPLPEI